MCLIVIADMMFDMLLWGKFTFTYGLCNKINHKEN